MTSLRIALTALLVRDYDEALAFFVNALGFELREDAPLPNGKRWVIVGPRGGGGLLLAQAVDDLQRACVGAQGGGRVFLFLETDDFARDHALFADRGVVFVETPRREAYGTVAVFEDLYGNRWDLIESAKVDARAPADATGHAREPHTGARLVRALRASPFRDVDLDRMSISQPVREVDL